MSRFAIVLACAAVAGCIAAPDDESVATQTQDSTVTRVNLGGDVWETTFTIRVGTGPNAVLRLHRVVRERSPGWPRATSNGVMLMHGDFSSFDSNFSLLAPYLAQQGVDVWGYDRRWASAPLDADLSDFGDMGVVQELDDTATALIAARAARLVTGSGGDKLILAGFSRGGLLAYLAASRDAARPAALRNLKGLVPLDVYYEVAPEEAGLRENACLNAEFERDALADGLTDSENSFFTALGELALSAPDEPSPIFGDPFTNAGALLWIVGLTHDVFQPTPVYHLDSAVLDDTGMPIALRDSPFTTVATWIANATPHQSMREAAETDALWCGEPPFAIDAPLSRIRVPVFYLGAAGGYGDHGIDSTTQVASTDVTTLVIRRLPVEREAEDFGHADLLFATDAPTLAWQPLVAWIRSH